MQAKSVNEKKKCFMPWVISNNIQILQILEFKDANIPLKLLAIITELWQVNNTEMLRVTRA